MQGFRDLTAQCGDPTALSQLSSGVSSMPGVVADARAYDSRVAGGMPVSSGPAGAMLASSARVQAQTADAMRMAAAMSSEFEEKSAARMAGMAAPAVVATAPGMTAGTSTVPVKMAPPMAAGMGPAMMMPPPGMIRPMAPYMAQPMMVPPMHPATRVAVATPKTTIEEASDRDTVSTNGTSEMKTEEEVREELAKLTPSVGEKDAINEVLRSMAADSTMQDSKLMELLKSIGDKEESKSAETMSASADGSEDVAAMWRRQFEKWSPVDDIDWASYMRQLDPATASALAGTASASASGAAPATSMSLGPSTTDPTYVFSQQESKIEEPSGTEEKKTMGDDSLIRDEVDDRDWFAEGLRLMREGNLNEAIVSFERVVKESPLRSEAWRYLGVCHADNECEKQAIAAFLKCHELDPFDLDALLQLGVCFTNEIEQFRALDYLKQWMANHPDYSTIVSGDSSLSSSVTPAGDLSYLGGWSGLSGELRKVIKMFNDAIQINSGDCDLHIVLGVLYNLTSEFSKGQVHFKKALQIKPDDPSLWNKLGATQANGGDYESAIQAYSRALEIKPNYVRALSNLGISFANQDSHIKACQSYLASLKQNPQADSVWDHLSMSLIHLGRGDLMDLAEKRDITLFEKHFDF